MEVNMKNIHNIDVLLSSEKYLGIPIEQKPEIISTAITHVMYKLSNYYNILITTLGKTNF